MIKRFFILLLAIVASVGMGWATENSIVINGTPQVGDNSISLTYYFDPANVPGITNYAPTLKVKCVTDNIWDEVWLSLSEISSGTQTINLNTLGSFQAGKEYAICYAYYNGSWVDEVFQSFSFPATPAPAVIDLATITSDYVIPDGTTLTGTLGTNVKISIAPGATVTLNGVDINGSGAWTGGDYAGITCPGNATIILADGTVNRIKGFLNGNSAIHIKPNYTLTIEGNGTLYASTQGGAAAIGCGYSDASGSRNGGNIVINGGTIYADGGSLAAGIGGGGRATIGNITINGGIIYAVGGGTGAGIGGGQSKSNSWKSTCGNITISSNVKYLKATKGSGAAHSIGIGSSSYSVCGTVTIPGGATGYVSTNPYVYCNPDYVIELINAIPQPVVLTAECKAAIDEARAMYTDLTDDQETSVTNYSTLTDAEAAYAALLVEDKIAAIGTVEYTAESKALIDAARTAYDALSVEAKALVTNYSTLTDAETAYAALIQAGADAVTAKINAIPTPVTLKLATRDSINNARAAYDALNAAQQALVTNYQTLLDAEAALAALNPGGGAPSTELQGDGSIENPYLIGGLEAWNAFADAVAAGVKPANAKLTNNIEGVTRMVGNFTNYYTGVFDGNGFTITMNIETNLDSAGLFRCVKEATFMNLNLEGTFTTSRKFAGSLVGAQLSINTLVIKNVCSSVAMTLSGEGDLTSGGIVGLRLGTIQITDCLFKGSMTSTGSGSMCGGIVGYSSSNLTLVRVIQAGTYNLNTSSYDGVFVRNNDANLNAQDCYYINGVGGQSTCAAATKITTDQLNTQTYVDLLQTGKEETYWVLKDGMLVWNHHEASSPSPLDSAQAVKDLIVAIPVPVTLDDACVNAIEDARAAYDALSEAAQDALDAATVKKLTDAEKALKDLNQEVADEVVAKINNIPLPVELKLATRDSIQNARAAYDALTADQKPLVSNYTKLTDAEDALAALNPGVPPATPLDSAQAVKDLIDAISTPVEYPTSGPAIAAALVAYQQLSEAAQGALDDADVQKMTDAATQYAALDAIAAIDAIPAEIVYDPLVKAAIETAREKYDALIDASKALVDDEVVAKLTNAEKAWAAIAAKVEHNVSYIGKDGELKNEIVALLHIPDPAPDFNGYEFVRWDVKASDFLEEGLRVKAVYTPIITTNPQGFDTLAYNGLAQELVAAGEAKEGHIEYSLYPEEPESWSAELPKATIAGVYAIYYKLVREGHEDYIADPINVTIAKAPVAYTAPTAYDTLVYNYNMQTLIEAGITNDGIFEYTLTPGATDSWNVNLPQAQDAGTYAVYYRVIGDINHFDSTAVAPVAVTIAKRDIVVEAPVAYDTLVYNAAEQTLVIAGSADFNVMEYSLDTTVQNCWSIELPKAVTADPYTVYYRVPGDDNHNEYEAQSIAAFIAQAPLTITAEDSTIIYGDAVPEFIATYSGWQGQDDETVVSNLAFSCAYQQGSYIGTYAINPNSATAHNYAITFVDGTLTVNKAHVYVSDAEAQIAKFADGHANAVVLEQGILNGIKLNDPIAHVTTAAFSSADVAENLTITLFYELTGDAALLNNYNLDPTSDIFTNEGVIIEPFLPDNDGKPEDQEAEVKEGIEVYAYGYCDGSGYSLKYHLNSGYPDQYKIEFADSRFDNVDYTETAISGRDGEIYIEIPAEMPTGDYTMTVTFRDSRFDWLESQPFTVTFHVNLPETYVQPLFNNTIVLIDTCECFTDIQWYYRANSTELWQPIAGATGHYYHVDGELKGEYFVAAKVNGMPTFTCGQADMETLYGETKPMKVKAFPNPVVTATTVTVENAENNDHTLRVVNLMGVEVMKTTFEGNETVVDMSACTSGNYMITVDGIVVKVMKK